MGGFRLVAAPLNTRKGGTDGPYDPRHLYHHHRPLLVVKPVFFSFDSPRRFFSLFTGQPLLTGRGKKKGTKKTHLGQVCVRVCTAEAF